MTDLIATARKWNDSLDSADRFAIIFALLAGIAAVAAFTDAADTSPDLLLIPALAIGIPAAFVLAHDLRGVIFDDYLALPTTAGAGLALGVAIWLLTIAT